jgi:ElaB/YqjD/DUF883 family membrane-anchored ribosome-binding protein
MPENTIKELREPALIQAEIERAREEITRSVLALRERVNEATDWRTWVRRRPALALTVAFGVGFWLGYRSGH